MDRRLSLFFPVPKSTRSRLLLRLSLPAALAFLLAVLGAFAGPIAQVGVAQAAGVANGWTVSTGSMYGGFSQSTATLLPDGDVLVAGGTQGFTSGGSDMVTAVAELYNPNTETWSATGSLNAAREEATATLLPDGKVLVAGGFGFDTNALTSAELYDPSTGIWSLTGSLNQARGAATATLLPDGQVLAAGGAPGTANVLASLSSAELYDPTTGTWSLTGSLNVSRSAASATLLQNGKVLVCAGLQIPENGYTNFNILSSAELYDASTGTWTPTGSLNVARQGTTVTLLQDGRVLAAGGGAHNGAGLLQTELYDPTMGTWSLTGNLTLPTAIPMASLLPDGQVLLTGGFYAGAFLKISELYNPSSGTWSNTGSMSQGRIYGTATLLQDGTVLVAGGAGGNSSEPTQLNESEFYGESAQQDTTPPTLSLPGTMTVNATDASGATVTYAVTATDPDNASANLTITCTPPSGSTFPIGTTTVSCSASDRAGNTASGSFQVVVQDTQSPTLSLPGTITANATDATGALVDYTVMASDPLYPASALTVGCDPSSGSVFPIGTTTVSCSVTDPAGNSASGSFLVMVQDTLLPTLSLPGTITMNATDATGATVDYTVTASDPIYSAGSLTISCDPSSGSTFPVGTTTVSCSATDPAGNSVAGSFQVVVQDTLPPTLGLLGNITVNATSPAGAVVNYTVAASDPIYPTSALTVHCTPSSGSTFPLGATTVSCSASDPAGNSANESFQVTVQDTQAPVLSLLGTITTSATSSAGAVVNYVVMVSDPVYPITSLMISCTPPSGSTFPIGTTTVSCSATDPAGNSASGSFQVIVQDTFPPVLSLPGNLIVNATSSAGASVTYTVTANDPLYPASSLTISCSSASGSVFPIGTATVSCSAADPAGNSATGSFQVVVVGAAGQLVSLDSQINSFQIQHGVANSLEVKVQQALDDVNAGDLANAKTSLNALSNEVSAQSGKALTTAQATQIQAVITQIEHVLGS